MNARAVSGWELGDSMARKLSCLDPLAASDWLELNCFRLSWILANELGCLDWESTPPLSETRIGILERFGSWQDMRNLMRDAELMLYADVERNAGLIAAFWGLKGGVSEIELDSNALWEQHRLRSLCIALASASLLAEKAGSGREFIESLKVYAGIC